MLFVLLIACRVANVEDACVRDPELCPACEGDDDCAYGGNPCLETVYCAHVAAGIAVIEIGCSTALEYSWPDAETCRCVDEVCRSD